MNALYKSNFRWEVVLKALGNIINLGSLDQKLVAGLRLLVAFKTQVPCSIDKNKKHVEVLN